MAHELEYIVKDALMTCDKGAAPGFFRPTYNMTTKMNGCLVTTEMDKLPIVNIPSFGVCTATQKPCVPIPTEWQKTYKVKVHGAETLLFRSCMQCSLGGKIEFATSGQIPLPPDALEDIEKMREQGMKEEESGFGWLDALEMVPVVGSIVGAVREGVKGNWGMMAANIGFLAMDVGGLFTGGATTIAATAAKTTLKAGIKTAAKVAAKSAAKQIGKSGLKTGVKLSSKGALKAFRNNIDNIVGIASKGKLCVFACFPAGTPVHTEFGVRNIEEVKAGDRVWSYDENTGETALKEILRTMVREADVTLKLKIGDEMIETTAEHPFHTQDGWKDAAALDTSDSISRKDNQSEKVKSAEYSYDRKKVFNFEVADWHTYFVGVWAWLVHNADVCASTAFKYAKRFGIKSYSELKKLAKGLGAEVHHLFEKRFAEKLGKKAQEMLATVLTKDEHRKFTNVWRQLIPYGKGTKNATVQEIKDAAKKVYEDYPEILKALGL